MARPSTSTRFAVLIRWILALSVLVLAALAGCAVPVDGDTHEACELEPQTVGSTSQGIEEDVGTVQEELSSHSCNMSSTKGYSSGSGFDIKVVTVDGKKVEWKTANAYLKMAQAAAKAGVEIRIVSGFRSMAEQQYLYNCYKTCSCNGCNLAATPGYSNHQSGHALDLNTSSNGVYGWLSKHAGAYGFKRTVPSENWHWEWWGKDDGSGPCHGATLKAKLTKRWSNARRHRGNKANYTVCAGDKVKLSFTFKNKGSAIWHDVDGRGSKVGSDVFLVTANGKTDKLTGKKRFSVNKNKNQHVHGDRKAKDCSTKNGCRRTTFIKGAIEGTAPKKPGIYTTRWRLRDYSKAWDGHSKGFGPKVQLKFQVVSCNQPKAECGCRVWCTDGKSQKLPASITSAAMCKSVADTYCKPAAYLDHSFQACESPSGGTGTGGATGGGATGSGSATGAGGAGAGSGAASDPSAPSTDLGSSDSSSSDEAASSEGPGASPADEQPAAESSADEGDEDDDNGLESTDDADDGIGSEEPDDPDFEDDGYPGYDEDAASTPESNGCSVSPSRDGAPLGLGIFALIGAAVIVRRRGASREQLASAQRREAKGRRPSLRPRRAGMLLFGLLSVASLLAGCAADTSASSRRATLDGDSPLVAVFRDAEAETGVPAEMLATLSWLQARLSMNLGESDTDSHGLPRESGLMAIGTGGLRTLEQVASDTGLDPSVVATEPRENVRAAALWLAAEAKRQGLAPTQDADWAPVLAAWGGAELSSGVLRLLSSGWDGSDDDGYGVSVGGSAAESASELEGSGLGTAQQELGYPGGKWSPAASGNYTNANRGKSDINAVVIHTTQGSYAGAISWFKNPSAKVSSHYVVRSHDGAVTQMVDDRDIAWHDACFNTHSIGIEHEGFVSAPGKWYTEAMYRSSARLVAWLCDKYGIPKDRKHIVGHGEAPDCSDHTDPGSGWDWGQYMKLVKSGGKIETLKAKAVKKWSNARRYRGKGADYVACAGDDVKLGFTFKNVGSAIWHDVKGRGTKVGSDVFLVTTNGKKDVLTGRERFSLRNNLNQHVHGDRKAKDCTYENGCRRTKFIAGGMEAKAPKKPGIYHSRWRLRDYSKAWGSKSKGFGPKVDLSLKVVQCDQPKDECGCRVWCSDGKSQKLSANITSNTACKSVAETFCSPAKYLSHSFQACGVGDNQAAGGGGAGSEGQGTAGMGSETGGGSAGAGGAGGSGGASAGAGGASAGAGGTSGAAGAAGASGGDADDDSNGYGFDDGEDDPDILPIEDDADFDDDGFDGDDEAGAEPSEAGAGCTVASTGSVPRMPLFALALAGVAVVARRRRRRLATAEGGAS